MSERLLYIGKLPAGKKFCSYLQTAGYTVRRAEGLRPSLRAISDLDPCLIIFDTNDSTNISLSRITRTARRRTTKPYVILLTSNRGSAFEDAVYDSILVHPFTSRRLEQQVRELLDSRRDCIVSVGQIILDRRTQRVNTPAKGTFKLTPKQFYLLSYLVDHVNELVTRKDLMKAVWDTTYLGDTRTLDVHVRWLRERLENEPNNPELIVTIRGQGYCLAIDEPLQIGGDPLI